MNRHNLFCATAILIWVAATVAAAAQQQVPHPSPIILTTPIVAINHSAGDETLPHVSKDRWTVSTIVNSGFNQENPECSGEQCSQDG